MEEEKKGNSPPVYLINVSWRISHDNNRPRKYLHTNFSSSWAMARCNQVAPPVENTHTHTGIICKFRPNFGMKALRNSTHFCGGTFLARSNPIPRRARPIIGEATRIYRIDPGIQSAADESGVGANRVAFHGGDGSFASQSTRNLYRSGWWFIPTGWWNRNIHSRSRISIEKSEW